MRILMIAPQPFLEPRGTPFCVYYRAKALIALGYEVDLVTYPMGKQVRLPGLRIYRAPGLPFIRKVKVGPSFAKFPLDLLVFLTAIWRLCLRRYRYLHTHEEAALMGVLLAVVFQCKLLYDMHSDLSQQMSNFAFTKNRLLIRCVEAIEKFMIHRANVIIAICPDLEQTVKRIAPNQSVYMIENLPVDEALLPAREDDVARLRRQWNLGDGPVLLYTGTFETYQGLDLLLQSVKAVCSEFPTARYVLVGGHPEQVEQQRLLAEKLGVAEVVRFVGQRPPEEMPQYMALADILLSPRSEGTNTPLKVYTYLHSGKPILATAILSHTQILTSDIVQLVEPTSEGLTQGALALLKDSKRAQTLGEAGRQFAEKYYSWPVFLEKHRQAYGELTALAR